VFIVVVAMGALRELPAGVHEASMDEDRELDDANIKKAQADALAVAGRPQQELGTVSATTKKARRRRRRSRRGRRWPPPQTDRSRRSWSRLRIQRGYRRPHKEIDRAGQAQRPHHVQQRVLRIDARALTSKPMGELEVLAPRSSRG
jgi:hypothetical protein